MSKEHDGDENVEEMGATSDEVWGKSVLITGANRGIGLKLLEGFLQEGAGKVYAAVRSVNSVQGLVDRYHERVVPIRLDLTDQESVSAAAEKANDVEIVVNNAGVLRASDLRDERALEALRFEIEVNLYGLIRMAQSFAPVLKANGGGHFVQINSIASIPDFATFTASKAAAYSITQSLQSTLAMQNTRVISVHPGPILTDMGIEAGLTDIAEPAEVVASALFEAIATGKFHAWAGSLAKRIGATYEGTEFTGLKRSLAAN
ncbi:MAG: SDR family oxidoreductase [Verrucomicrobiota bacterium]